MSRVRVLLLGSVAVLLVVVVASVALRPGVAVAAAADDPCGAQPPWWDAIDWVPWEACEISNGNAAAPITEVTSPIFNTIDQDLQNISGSLGGLPGSIASALGGSLGAISSAVGAVVTFITPHSTDFASVFTALSSGIGSHQPFVLINAVASDVSVLQSAMSSTGGSLSAASPVGAGGVHESVRSLSAIAGYDFGPLAGGVQMWLDFMALCNMPASTVSALFSVFIVLTTVWSLLADLGVRTGVIEPGSAAPSDIARGAVNVVSRGRTWHKSPGSLTSRRYG